MDLIITLTGILLLALLITFLNKNRNADEHGLPLKLAGYYILGIFNLKINGILIPFGFIISLFIKPTANNKIKRVSSIAGLLVMLTFHII